jgi:hypothetical protein
MFSFNARKKRGDVRRYLARICDHTTPNYAAPCEDERAKNRHNRSIPTLICPWENGMPCVDEAAFVLTKDISDAEIGIVSNQPICANEVLVALWPGEEVSQTPWFFLCEVRRNAPLGGGFWILGVELIEFANAEYQNLIKPLMPLAERLRVPTPVNIGQTATV